MHEINRELIFLYAENSRLKLKEVAQQLQKSSPRLKYNLSQLAKARLVYQPHVVIDYSFFGQLLFRVYFKGGYISEKDKAAILQKLEQHPSVVSIAELGGEFDLVIELQAPNPSRFNKELKKLITTIPTLNNYKLALNIVTHLYPRSYLPQNLILQQQRADLIVGGDRQIEKFSSAEMKLLQLLLDYPTSRVATLATRAGMNAKTVTTLLKELRKRRVIRAFQSLIDTNALGISKHRLFLKLHNVSAEREEELLNFFLKTPEVVQVNKTVGDWHVEADIEAWEKSRIHYLITALREEFADVIETFNNIEFYQYHKKSYLAKAVVKGE